MYLIQHVWSGRQWDTSSKAEARMYADIMPDYAVFKRGGSGVPITKWEV